MLRTRGPALHNTAPKRVVDALEAFQKIIVLQEGRFAHNDMMAYLVMMTARLLELHRILKPTGSLYLHCDPTASHYLKVILDTVFGPTGFRNEIVWQRTGAHNDAKRYGRVTDSILLYTKSEKWTWNPQYTPYSPEYIQERYRYVDENTGRLHWRNTMTAAGPGPARLFRGQLKEPPPGTHWRFSQEEIDRLEKEGHIYYSPSGMPYVKSFLDELPGRPLQNLWSDIVMSKSGKERTRYATQKPLALLERIIQASSNEGDVVLDPFCGCGTAVLAAHKLNRRWIGIDVTILAVNVMKERLQEAFPDLKGKYRVIGEPTTLSEAKALAAMEPALEMRYQFQYWALGLVGARPASDSRKKGADAGVDGYFSLVHSSDGKKETYIQVIVQVKSGHVGANLIRDLAGTVGNDKLGLFITLEEPTEPMKAAALAAGLYHNPLMNTHHPRIQTMTIAELLDGKSPNLPPHRPGWERGSYIGQRSSQIKLDMQVPPEAEVSE
ncbi:MAG: site-specific DNA-methyltransferase [Chloroflexota bacterium]